MPAATCTLGRRPIDAGLLGNITNSNYECYRGGDVRNRLVRIERWAVIYTPFRGKQFNGNLFSVCAEEISLVYVRSNKTPMLYHRAAKFGDGNFDCSKIPIRKIMAWGKDRKEFITLLKTMSDGLKIMRLGLDCDTDPNKKYSRTFVNSKLFHERVTTAAITFVDGVAFNSYLCV